MRDFPQARGRLCSASPMVSAPPSTTSPVVVAGLAGPGDFGAPRTGAR